MTPNHKCAANSHRQADSKLAGCLGYRHFKTATVLISVTCLSVL